MQIRLFDMSAQGIAGTYSESLVVNYYPIHSLFLLYRYTYLQPELHYALYLSGFSDNPFFSLRDTVFSENPVTAGAAVTGFSEN